MEIFSIDQDIPVITVEAASFPDGIMVAWEKLHSLLTPDPQRKFFGISRPEPAKMGGIVYRAAAGQSFEGEAASLGAEVFTIRKGNYLSEMISDWKTNVTLIGSCFQRLIKDPRVDPQGYCLEIYNGDSDVHCMVLLRQEA